MLLQIRTLVGVGQEAFLVQLLEVGFFHGDPHPGNLLKVTEGPDAGKLALLDFGLVAEIPPQDRAAMVSATIHLVSLGVGRVQCGVVLRGVAWWRRDLVGQAGSSSTGSHLRCAQL